MNSKRRTTLKVYSLLTSSYPILVILFAFLYTSIAKSLLAFITLELLLYLYLKFLRTHLLCQLIRVARP